MFAVKFVPALVAAAVGALFGNAHGAVVVNDPDELIRISGAFPPVPFDVDGDGGDDLSLRNDASSVFAASFNSNQIIGMREFVGFSGAAIAAGEFIGSAPPTGTEWADTEVELNACSTGTPACSGNFIGGIAYLGIEFDIAGATHYGWLEIESSSLGSRAWIHRWAYETEPGVGLIAGIPEPGVPSLLLVGGGVLACVRRRRRIGTKGGQFATGGAKPPGPVPTTSSE